MPANSRILPSMSGALKDSGSINFSLEEDEDKKVEDRVDSDTTSNERMGTTQNTTTLTCVTIFMSNHGEHMTQRFRHC